MNWEYSISFRYGRMNTVAKSIDRMILQYFSQVFVETLDRCFENVCELDLIFHYDKVRNQWIPYPNH